MGKKNPQQKKFFFFSNGLLASAFERPYPSVNTAFVFFLIFRCPCSTPRGLRLTTCCSFVFLQRMQIVLFSLFLIFVFFFLTLRCCCEIRSTWLTEPQALAFQIGQERLHSFSDYSIQAACRAAAKKVPGPEGQRSPPETMALPLRVSCGRGNKSS